LYGDELGDLPPQIRDELLVVSPFELPSKRPRLLARSTGWLRAKRIYTPDAQRVQADAFFALKMAGGALKEIHNFFVRDYFLEQFEHMVDNASYTSVYPRVSLGPEQRFVSKGAYIAEPAPKGSGALEAVTGWVVPHPQ
jgi:hypothetical protein